MKRKSRFCDDQVDLRRHEDMWVFHTRANPFVYHHLSVYDDVSVFLTNEVRQKIRRLVTPTIKVVKNDVYSHCIYRPVTNPLEWRVATCHLPTPHYRYRYQFLLDLVFPFLMQCVHSTSIEISWCVPMFTRVRSYAGRDAMSESLNISTTDKTYLFLW